MRETTPPDAIELPNQIERTPELFWNTNDWGAKSGIQFEDFDYLWQAARHEYDPEFEAHNFDHGMDSLWRGNELADEYEAAGSQDGPINRRVLNAAFLLHDAGKYDDFLKSGFETQEEFTIIIAKPILRFAGYNEEEIEAVSSVIASTAENATLVTPNQKIMGMADLHNIGEEEPSFKARTKDFLAEAHRTQGETFDRLKFKVGTLLILGANLTKDFSLTGMSQEWRQQAIANFQGMIEEYAQEEPECLPKALRAVGGAALASLLPESLYVKLRNDDDLPTAEMPIE